jgi:hypothetical protein
MSHLTHTEGREHGSPKPAYRPPARATESGRQPSRLPSLSARALKDASGQPYLALPAKKTVTDPLAEFIQGTPVGVHIDGIACEHLKLPDNAYDVDQEFEAIEHDMPSPRRRDDHGQPLG